MDSEAIRHYSPAPDVLKDRVILVTGASRGIGRSVAKAYAAHGATVILLARDLKRLEQLYDEIEGAGQPQPALYPMNLEGATAKDYEDLAATADREFGRLDGLLNNAADVSGLTPLAHYDIERWMRVMTVNLHAPFLLTRVCLPLLERAPDPAVVFSTHACTRAYWGAYGVAKHAQEGLLQILACEHRSDRPIRFNGVDTGAVRTRLRVMNYPGEDPHTLPDPEAVITPYLYLMGPDSRGVTGQNLDWGRLRATS
jgi:NAD(P)-dependent dehydrogenase (short-subunit alcohol dehydrogenase family)